MVLLHFALEKPTPCVTFQRPPRQSATVSPALMLEKMLAALLSVCKGEEGLVPLLLSFPATQEAAAPAWQSHT